MKSCFLWLNYSEFPTFFTTTKCSFTAKQFLDKTHNHVALTHIRLQKY
ncbi:hypothetical+protein [Escherichia coli]|uniref:Uncharacterized protein n=1 Tax=Escherichia coli TaxID=562 RepID=A0ABD7W6D7_ECOLX|nr:hypothetical protein BvCmsSINP014_01461 [Escherichia coli]CAA0231393.1 hypothetical+protein [Escherichia coli]VZR32506.1 Uncharacterised protein [Escherichia coli]VZR32618.1 Uncharacterised protein [Escherichia coli]